MINSTLPFDHSERARALDPRQSFIVQAPAGSGKTELLVQRFLVLLAHAEKAPEEIVAITFTRKAAHEMRTRIIDALRAASNSSLPEKKPSEKTLTLAKAALQKNNLLNWNLLQNPNRLRIQTIDSLCQHIVRQMPVMTHWGALPEMLDQPQEYYQMAALALLDILESDGEEAYSLRYLLSHLDNDHSKTQQLLAELLARRDLWLSHILQARRTGKLKDFFETTLKNIMLENIENCQKNFPADLKTDFIELAQFAAQNLKDQGKDSPINECINHFDLSTLNIENLPFWQGAAHLLLTSEKQWRKQVDIRCGFPPKGSLNESMKILFKNVLAPLHAHEELQQNLIAITESPPLHYSTEQWKIVESLLHLLPLLAAQLTVLFRKQGVADFIEISSGALHALGELESPSDLALKLDYQIRHLLIDEFQDTSNKQYQLIELLTAGWVAGDGRSLFLVGDPMQSIYRFREAEVGLFLRTRKQGLGNIRLIPLNLSVNFRSSASIIAWLNNIFSQLFPMNENITQGKIKFSPSVAQHSPDSDQSIFLHPCINAQNSDQVNEIMHIIKTIKTHQPQYTIGVLVRSRNHLTELIPALREANIPFRGIEIEKLNAKAIIQDLFALTRALLHLADRIAWLAILRAPYCGLELSDIFKIANRNPQQTIWQLMKRDEIIQNLSDNGKQRLLRILPVLETALANRQRYDLRQWIESCWYALAGPACVNSSSDLEHAKVYFELLEDIQKTQVLPDLLVIENKLKDMYAAPDPAADDTLQIMTIHKAKGLEFDCVILPFLEKIPQKGDSPLFRWMERSSAQNGNELLIAPIKASANERDELYQYLGREESTKINNEMIRLLYVAATRSKKQLHLVANALTHDNNEKSAAIFKYPSKGSFLNLLWPCLENEFIAYLSNHSTKENLPDKFSTENLFYRLDATWQAPVVYQHFLAQFSQTYFADQYNNKLIRDRHWQDQTEKCLGTITHDILYRVSLAKENKRYLIVENISYWKKRLQEIGILPHQVDAAWQKILSAIHHTLNDARGQWILSHDHHDSHSEYPLSIFTDNKLRHYIIDRTFIDEENSRWIIDYKTAEQNGNIDEFLQAQFALYEQQLQQYAHAFSLLDPTREIKIGLYFPRFGGWISETATAPLSPELHAK